MLYADCSLEQEVPECPQKYIEWVREASRGAFEDAKTHLKQSAQRQKRNYDKNTHLREFTPGDWVWVLYPPEMQKKLGGGWQGPYLVVRKLGDVNYVVQDKPEGRLVTLHVDHMKCYLHEDTPESWLDNSIQAKNTIGIQTDF